MLPRQCYTLIKLCSHASAILMQYLSHSYFALDCSHAASTQLQHLSHVQQLSRCTEAAPSASPARSPPPPQHTQRSIVTDVAFITYCWTTVKSHLSQLSTFLCCIDSELNVCEGECSELDRHVLQLICSEQEIGIFKRQTSAANVCRVIHEN